VFSPYGETRTDYSTREKPKSIIMIFMIIIDDKLAASYTPG
jgi:hypothetical protein